MKVKLSASRIKTAQSCSWRYYCSYILKLPDKSNDGASRGSVCHNVFEYLSKLKTKNYYNKIVKNQDPLCVPSVKKMITSMAKELKVDDEENMSLIKEMILNGLSCDFYGEELGIPDEAHAELDFDIEANGYHIRGFIDQLFLYKDKKIALIRDYKTSKSVFQGKEISDNLQDYIYCLAIKHLFPEYENRQSEFLFLKFDLKNKGRLKMKSIEEDDMDGFEIQLSSIQDWLENFDENDAKSNFAAKKRYPTDKSFSGPLMCGFAKTKGQLKVDGSPMWACPMRHPFSYVKILDSKGNFLKSVFEEDFLEEDVPEGGSFEKQEYLGCPHFYN